MEEPGVPDGGENLLLAMDWDDSALVQAWNQSLRLYRGVAGGGEYNPSFSTEENRLIFSYWKSCCIFYKLRW